MNPVRRMAFDIETQSNPDRINDLPEPDVATGNLKDPVKIAEKVKEAKAKQLDKLALDPHFGRVICISIAQRDAGDGGQIVGETALRLDMGEADRDDAESELLKWFWDRVRNATHFVTYNGAGFDVPYLMRRSLLLGVRPARIECGKYRVVERGCEHLDLFQLLVETWGSYASCSHNLRFMVSEFLREVCPYGDDLDKGELGRLFEAKQFEIIKQVCTWDCMATLRLCEAVESVYA